MPRNNVFLLQFMTLGATIVSFAARREEALKAQLDEAEGFTRAQEQTVDLPPDICVGDCKMRH
jgi:hypothetical protein